MQQLVGLTVLWLMVLASGLGVIYAAHQSRNYVNELEVLRRQEANLQVVWGQFLLERGALSAYSRVERIATTELDMVVPKGEDIVVIEP